MSGFGVGGFFGGGPSPPPPPQQQQQQPSLGGFGGSGGANFFPVGISTSDQQQREQERGFAFGQPAPPPPQQQQQQPSFVFGQPSGGFSGGAGAVFGTGGFGGGGTSSSSSAGGIQSVFGAAGGSSSAGGFGGFGAASATTTTTTSMATTGFAGFGGGASTPTMTTFGAQQQRQSFGFGGGGSAGGGGFTPPPVSSSFSSSVATAAGVGGIGGFFGTPRDSTPNLVAPSPALSFGRSSTVVINDDDAMSGGAMPPSSTITNNTTTTTPFAAPSTTATAGPFGAVVGPSSSSSSGFVGPLSSSTGGFGTVTPPPTTMTTTTTVPLGFGRSSGSGFGAALSSAIHVPRKDRDSAAASTTGTEMTTAASPGGGRDDHLASLRAKIQEKRKKLEERLRQDEEQQQQQQRAGPANDVSGSMGATADANTAVGVEGAKGRGGDANAALAARNAVRFGIVAPTGTDVDTTTTNTLGRLLPADLRDRRSKDEDAPARGIAEDDDVNDGVEEDKAYMNGDGGGDDLDLRILSNAKSLIGTCTSMCPDEELLRREKEGDIQLLEVTDPGGLHPKSWTLRDTAVKRFRRSAADFKLDIPEWVRPPEVLERVCGYLEEWVMERDRQGPDKRWTQQPSDTPPPLDVYQFIWDRTRMVRKDYILQNYIGTGGKCDARAVRCHERIARWHAMCEHQLSHIPEFVSHQSQQNIAELGQTMKTLNNYYDDALGRSLTEVADSDSSTPDGGDSGGVQGCASDVVMGKSPVDFDGSTLENNSLSEDVSRRIIGKNGIKSKYLGTAEPEMRGLYILLTLNNEGGMEVLKYSGRLCVEKPAIFYSKPVQLALSIFQAKKDHNYARFFSLLRSPSTPYLYSCIMFKYVEGMRKDALIIMSRTYGAKNKTTGQPFFDEYPLKDLVTLLCYEDEEEASTACRHYGITVKGDQVLWRHSKFMEPRDPEKGHIIPLKPKKMIRIIESKLHGATRLSVCRGGVSGEGATLSSVTSPQFDDAAAEMDRIKARESAEKAKMEAMKLLFEAEAKAKAQEKIREMERIKQERLAAETRARAEAVKKAELMRLEEERLQRERILAEQRQKEEEARRLSEAEAVARRAERERREREAFEREVSRKKAEEEDKERERQRLLTRHREEEAHRVAQIKAARELAAKEQREREEKRRLGELRRKAEEDRIKRAQEEEARQIEMMWREKIKHARTLLAWRLWRKQMHKRESLEQSRQCLGRLDPTFTQCPTPHPRKTLQSTSRHNISIKYATEAGLENQIFRLATASRHPIDVSRLVAQSLDSLIPETVYPPNLLSVGNMIIFKLTVWLPKREGIESLYDSLRMWVNSHLRVGKVYTHTFKRRSRTIHIRVISVIGNEQPLGCRDSNAELLLLPSIAGPSSNIAFPEEAEKLLPCNVSRMVLVLDNNKCSGDIPFTEHIFRHHEGRLGQYHEGAITPKVCNFDHAFKECCEAVVKGGTELYSQESTSMARVSIANLGFLSLQRLLQNMDSEGCFRLPSTDDSVFRSSKHTLTLLVRELSRANEAHSLKHNWPPLEFFDKESSSIPAYFDWKYDLPRNWHVPLQNISRKVFDTFHVILERESFVEFVESSGPKKQSFLRQKLFNMIDNNDIPRCFVEVVSLLVDGELCLTTAEENLVYLPVDTIAQIIERVAAYNAPHVPDLVLRDIPSYLYSPILTEQVQRGCDNPTPGIEKDEKVASKRKTSERKESESPVYEHVKRGRTCASLSVESEEERQSKEFTAFLRHCFDTI